VAATQPDMAETMAQGMGGQRRAGINSK